MKKHLLLLLFLLTSAFIQAQNKIYWVGQADDKIYRANDNALMDGSEVAVNVSIPYAVAFFNSNPTYPVFHSEAFKIIRTKLDGTSPNTIYTHTNQYVVGIAIDYNAKKIYWTQYTDGIIARANLDGSNQEPLISGLSSPWDLELDLVNQKIYWGEAQGSAKIWRADLSDGKNVTQVGPVPASNVWCQGLAVDPARGKFYYSDLNSKKVYAANIDGSGGNHVAIVPSGIKSPGDIDVDYATGRLILSDYGTKNIMRFDPDGSNLTSVTVSSISNFLEYADATAPSITSIQRQAPATADVDAGQTLTFRVTFSEPVLNIDATDFKLAGTLTGNLAVTHVSQYKVYDVAVSSISGLGVLGLDVAATPTLIDFKGNGFSGTVNAKETFTIHEPQNPGNPVGTEQQPAEARVFIQSGQEPGTMILHTGSLKGAGGQVIIYDATGTTLYNQEMIFSESVRLSTANYHSGLYIIRVSSNGKHYTQKVMIED